MFLWRKVDEEDGDTDSDADTLSDDDEIGCVWMEPSHGGGNLPAAVRRRLVPTVRGTVLFSQRRRQSHGRASSGGGESRILSRSSCLVDLPVLIHVCGLRLIPEDTII